MSAVVAPANEANNSTGSTEELIARVIALSQGMRRHVTGAVERMQEINRGMHLLSMNARIEAARAGTAGAGFAVVGQELTRLSGEMRQAADGLVGESRDKGAQLDAVLRGLNEDVIASRLCDLAFSAIDIVDRNLYERSCDVRWWATEPAVADCLKARTPESLRFASRRLGQILDSYTVYADLVVADTQGRVVANGRPAQFRSAGSDVGHSEWFESALAARRDSEFGFQSMHDSPLVNGQSSLVYSCAVRDPDASRAAPLGVLGIVFKWRALGDAVLAQLPLSDAERPRTRACLVDARGRILADTASGRGARSLEFLERDSLFRDKRGTVSTTVDGRPVMACHAASQGFETYRTGWHALLLRDADA